MWKTKVLTRHLAWWEKWVKACIVKDRLYIQKRDLFMHMYMQIEKLKKKKKIILHYINKKVNKIQ